MKHFKIIVLAFLIVAFCGACKQKSDVYKTPEKVTEVFIKAFATADFENMYKYSVPANAVIIRNLQKTMRNYPDKLAEIQKNEVEIVKVTSKSVNDTLAICKCDYKMQDGDHNSEFRVKKMDGKWLVDMSEN